MLVPTRAPVSGRAIDRNHLDPNLVRAVERDRLQGLEDANDRVAGASGPGPCRGTYRGTLLRFGAGMGAPVPLFTYGAGYIV